MNEALPKGALFLIFDCQLSIFDFQFIVCMNFI